MIDFYCIYKKDDSRSTFLMEECKASAKQFNISVSGFEGIYIDVHNTLKSEQLKIDPEGAHKVSSEGVIGCFLSHYFLWKKCLLINKPIGVLEYDAVFCNPLPANILSQFTDYCNLDFARHLYLKSDRHCYSDRIASVQNPSVQKFQMSNKKSSSRFKVINNNHINGAFGYILKPSGAKKLINSAKTFGILPADIQINLLYCDMYYTWPSVVHLNKDGIAKGKSHTK